MGPSGVSAVPPLGLRDALGVTPVTRHRLTSSVSTCVSLCAPRSCALCVLQMSSERQGRWQEMLSALGKPESVSAGVR